MLNTARFSTEALLLATSSAAAVIAFGAGDAGVAGAAGASGVEGAAVVDSFGGDSGPVQGLALNSDEMVELNGGGARTLATDATAEESTEPADGTGEQVGARAEHDSTHQVGSDLVGLHGTHELR